MDSGATAVSLSDEGTLIPVLSKKIIGGCVNLTETKCSHS